MRKYWIVTYKNAFGAKRTQVVGAADATEASDVFVAATGNDFSCIISIEEE